MSFALVVHVLCGGLGITTGAVAIIARKGGRVHRLSGDVFVAAMTAMGGAAVFLSLTLPDWANFPGGLFAVYLVVSGWAALTHEMSASDRWRSAPGWFSAAAPRSQRFSWRLKRAPERAG